jgi:hypothetical protein
MFLYNIQFYKGYFYVCFFVFNLPAQNNLYLYFLYMVNCDNCDSYYQECEFDINIFLLFYVCKLIFYMYKSASIVLFHILVLCCVIIFRFPSLSSIYLFPILPSNPLYITLSILNSKIYMLARRI